MPMCPHTQVLPEIQQVFLFVRNRIFYFRFMENFTFTVKLQRQSSHLPYTHFPLLLTSYINMLLFITINDPILINFYTFIQISLVLTFYSSRVPSRTPHYIQSTYFFRLLLPVTESQIVHFHMTSMVWRAPGQVFSRMPLKWDLSVVFLIIRVELQLF